VPAPWSFKLFIDGKWVEGEDGKRIDVIDPGTERRRHQARHRRRPESLR